MKKVSFFLIVIALQILATFICIKIFPVLPSETQYNKCYSASNKINSGTDVNTNTLVFYSGKCMIFTTIKGTLDE